MGSKFSGRRPEDQPMYVKPTQLDYEKRSLYVTSVSRIVQTIIKSVATFLGLSDTPSSYSGSANKIVKVNAAATALVFGKTEDDMLRDMIFDGGTADLNIDSSSAVTIDLGGA